MENVHLDTSNVSEKTVGTDDGTVGLLALTALIVGGTIGSGIFAARNADRSGRQFRHSGWLDDCHV